MIRVKKSLLTCVYTAVLHSQLVAADPAAVIEEPKSEPTAQHTEVVSSRAPITSDKDFVTAIRELGAIDLEDQLILLQSLQIINAFLQESASTQATQNQCETALNALANIAQAVRNSCKTSLLNHCRETGRGATQLKPYYHSSRLAHIDSYLHTLTKKTLKKVRHLHPILLEKTDNIEFFITQPGILYFLRDSANQLIPMLAIKLTKNSQRCIFHLFGGAFEEGPLSRAILNTNGQLQTQPGIFFNFTNSEMIEITICAGRRQEQESPPFLSRTIAFSQKRFARAAEETTDNHVINTSDAESKNKVQAFLAKIRGGDFIKFSDTESINKVQAFLTELAATSCKDKGKISPMLIPILSLLAELISREEDRQATRQAAIAQQKSMKKPAPKKGKQDSKKSKGKPSKQASETEAAVGVEGLDQVANDLTNESSTSVVKADALSAVEEDSLPTKPMAAGAAVPDDVEEEDNFGNEGLDQPESSEEAEKPEAPLTPEQLHQKLYDAVMATVPEGRIHQRVLDRLISGWLKITKIPMEKLQMFVRGSHRSLHVNGQGITAVRRHGRGDITHAPQEVRAFAKRVVGLVDPKK